MSLFLHDATLAQRKRDLQNPTALGGLGASLQRELHAALDVPVPEGKSRLTRYGGRCRACTVLLDFDPRQPHQHRCPQCGTVHTDQVHHQWWLMNAHLWTAEQCTRAAALAWLFDDERAATRADEVLCTYTEQYLRWPNRDNALGPTRPFFSTYLESIWLLHLATALDLRIAAAGRCQAQHAQTLDRLIAPSAALIAGFDEGRSNRQVWHSAALLAASGLLGDTMLRDTASRSLESLLRTGLHTDGSWYEGENYHLFAHRGLLSAVTLAERAGVELPAELMRRFESGFAAPFRTMLPDGTFPARRDSQYGVALRQYRTADWAECGFARNDTHELRSALASLYAGWPCEGDTGRASSTADAERNQPGVRLTRADCSWRALLLARLDLPELESATPHSELLEGQGLAVFRRDSGRFWVGLDYGDPGAGHGHPDRLNLVIATQHSRWLDDVGTGSYTSPTLAWYRSSMAHNAPMVNGRDQAAARGSLLAHEEQQDAGWVSAAFTDPVSGVRFERTVVVLDDHLLDEITWTSDADVFVDLPMQAKLAADVARTWVPFVPGASQAAMLQQPRAVSLPAAKARTLALHPLPSPAVPSEAAHPTPTFEAIVWSETEATLWSAGTIGPPAGSPHGLVALRQTGRQGRSLRVFALPGTVASLEVNAAAIAIETAGDRPARWSHSRHDTGWRVARSASAQDVVIELRGVRSVIAEAPAAVPAPQAPNHMMRWSLDQSAPDARVFAATTLGNENYRPTEESWVDAGSPTAQIGFFVEAGKSTFLVSAVVTVNRSPFFAAAVDDNPLDNEPADINSDGVQFHWRSFVTGEWNSLLAVPDGADVRLTVISGSRDDVTARWQMDVPGRSYSVFLDVPWPGLGTVIEYDCVINECPPDRERRRGQLVLSGAHGEFGYLRGARQGPERALFLQFHASPS